MSNRFGHVGIRSIHDPSKTASLLGEALGNLRFIAEGATRSERARASIAENDGLRYVLLVVPAQTHDFELIVAPISPMPGAIHADISAEIIQMLKVDARLGCAPIK